MQMLTLLRLPDAIEFQYNITTLLTDLGATQSEVSFYSVLISISSLGVDAALTHC